MPSYICPLIRPRYLQRSRRALVPIEDLNYLNETDEHPRFEDMIIMDQTVAVKESKASCSDSRKLAEEFIKEKMVSSNIICMTNLNPHCICNLHYYNCIHTSY